VAEAKLAARITSGRAKRDQSADLSHAMQALRTDVLVGYEVMARADVDFGVGSGHEHNAGRRAQGRPSTRDD
jgi:hypothetical protein